MNRWRLRYETKCGSGMRSHFAMDYWTFKKQTALANKRYKLQPQLYILGEVYSGDKDFGQSFQVDAICCIAPTHTGTTLTQERLSNRKTRLKPGRWKLPLNGYRSKMECSEK